MIDIDVHDDPFSLGYYSVGSKKYADKILALLDGARSNSHVEWNFHRDVFDTFDWKKRSHVPIRELYRRRAQFLREKYDYLTLHYSGGSDSNTALRAFIDNNIKLDEIYVMWAVKALEKRPVDKNDLSASNVTTEWELAIKPSLEWLAKYHPEIKIMVRDFSDDIVPVVSNLSEKDIYLMGGDFMGVGAVTKLRQGSQTHVEMLSRGKTAASILGMDKPRIVKIKNQVYLYFLDIMTNGSTSHRNKHCEAFYWSPDCPELIREQAHLLLDFFRARPDLQHIIDTTHSGHYRDKQLYDQIVKSVCYPDWDMNIWQSNKCLNGSFYVENDDWIKQRPDDGAWITNRWQGWINEIITAVDKRYLAVRNNRIEGFVGMISPYYEIGTLETPAL